MIGFHGLIVLNEYALSGCLLTGSSSLHLCLLLLLSQKTCQLAALVACSQLCSWRSFIQSCDGIQLRSRASCCTTTCLSAQRKGHLVSIKITKTSFLPVHIRLVECQTCLPCYSSNTKAHLRFQTQINADPRPRSMLTCASTLDPNQC